MTSRTTDDTGVPFLVMAGCEVLNCAGELDAGNSEFEEKEGRIVSSDSSETGRDKQLRLDHFLKLSGLSETGGQAKLVIQDGQVKVNGDVETRRGRKLAVGDIVEVNGETFTLDDALSDS